MENMTPGMVVAVVFGILGAIGIVLDTVKKVVDTYTAAKKPEKTQNDRIQKLENEVLELRGYLSHDDKRITWQAESTRLSQQALLALLNHGLYGNNVDQMKEAKDALQQHLLDSRI